MASYAFGALVEHESSQSPTVNPPLPAAQITRSQTDLGPTGIELNELQWGHKLNGPSGNIPIETAAPADCLTSATPREVEQSNPPTPRVDHAVNPVMSASNPSMNKWRLGANCLMVFTQGIHDSAPGALIPYLEQNYKIGYAIV